jgi:hypothetical protein
VKLQFRDCKEAIAFYIMGKIDADMSPSVTEACINVLTHGFCGASTNIEDLIGLDDVIHAVVDIEKILGKFNKPTQKAFFSYVLEGQEGAIIRLNRSWKGVGKKRITKRDYFYNAIRVLAQHLMKAEYLSKRYYAEQDDIEDVKAANEKNLA